MSWSRAFLIGLRRVQRAPALVSGIWLLTLAVAAPFAIVMDRLIAQHLGASLAAAQAADGVNFDWWNEFFAQTSGIGQTFVPAIVGFAAPLANLSDLLDRRALPTAVALAVAAHLVLSTLFLGGILDRLARDRAVGSRSFFGACGGHFLRLLRLAVAAGLVYAFLFTSIHAWLFEDLYQALTRDLAVERTAFLYRLLVYVVFGALLLGVNLVFDYAKIRIVVEDRRSVIGALGAAIRFVIRHPGGTIGLYALNAALFAGVLVFYFFAAPGASGRMALVALVVGQLYIVLRVIVRLQFAASQIAFFQSRLAHAAYVARPLGPAPDSPAVEAIRSAM